MISVTGIELSRACLDDHFSTYSRFALRAAARAARAATKGLLAFVEVTRDALGLVDELFFIPVVVVDVGAVETLDHLGGAGAGFDGLEDAEGDQGAATFVVQTVRVDDEGDVGEGLGEVEGVDADLPDVVPPADVEGRGGRLPRGACDDVREFEGDVADAGAPVGDAELAGARGDGLAILAAHMRDARANLCLRHPTCSLPRRHRLARAHLRHLCHIHVLTISFFRFWVAEQDTAWDMGPQERNDDLNLKCNRNFHSLAPNSSKIAEVPVNVKQPQTSAATCKAKLNYPT